MNRDSALDLNISPQLRKGKQQQVLVIILDQRGRGMIIGWTRISWTRSEVFLGHGEAYLGKGPWKSRPNRFVIHFIPIANALTNVQYSGFIGIFGNWCSGIPEGMKLHLPHSSFPNYSASISYLMISVGAGCVWGKYFRSKRYSSSFVLRWKYAQCSDHNSRWWCGYEGTMEMLGRELCIWWELYWFWRYESSFQDIEAKQICFDLGAILFLQLLKMRSCELFSTWRMQIKYSFNVLQEQRTSLHI